MAHDTTPTLDPDRTARSTPRVKEHRVVFWVLAVLLLGLPTVTLPDSGPWLAVKAFALEAVAIALAVLVFSRGEWTGARVKAAVLNPVNLAALGFLLWVGVSAAGAPIPKFARYEAMRHLGGGLVYFAILYGISARRQLNGFVRLLAVVASLAAIAAFLNAQETSLQAVAGAFHNRQLLAGFLCLLFPLVLIASQLEEETWPKIGLQVAVVIVGAGVMVSFNRSAWFGTVAGVLLLAVLYLVFGREPGTGIQKAQVILPVLIIALTVGLFLMMSRLSGSLSQRAGTLSALSADQSFQWRLGMWDKGLRMFRDRPLAGWGVGSFPIVQAQYPHPAVRTKTQLGILRKGPSLSENAHNTFLQLAAETGIIGVSLFGAVFVAFFVTGFRALRRLRRGFRQGVVMGSMGGVTAMLVSSVGNPAWEFAECSAFLWCMLAVGMVAAGAPDAGRESSGRAERD